MADQSEPRGGDAAPPRPTALDRALDVVLADPGVRTRLEQRAEAMAEAAVRTQLAWRIRWLKILSVVMGFFGLTTAGILFWTAREVINERQKIQESLELIGQIPGTVMKTSAAYQRLRNEQLDLAAHTKRYWELDDEIEQLDVFREQIGPRMTSLLQLAIRGEITTRALENGRAAVNLFNEALGTGKALSSIKRREQQLEAAIDKDVLFEPKTLEAPLDFLNLSRQASRLAPDWVRNLARRPGFAEPRVKLAELRINTFADALQNLSNEARVGVAELQKFGAVYDLLTEARAIVGQDRSPFYGKTPYAEYLLGFIDYQTARFHVYFAAGCTPSKRDTDERDKDDREQLCRHAQFRIPNAKAALDSAQRHYGAWRQSQGFTEGRTRNPTYTYLKALIAYRVDHDLPEAVALSRAAVQEARQRQGADYADALNLAAWAYAEGAEREAADRATRGHMRDDGGSPAADQFGKFRIRALRYVQRALDVTRPDDAERRAQLYATLAAVFRSLNMGYHALVADRAALTHARMWEHGSSQDEAIGPAAGMPVPAPEPIPAAASLKAAVCTRMLETHGPKLLTGGDEARDFRVRFRRGHVTLLLVQARALCPGATPDSDDELRAKLNRADEAFTAEIDEAVKRGSGSNLMAEMGLAMSNVYRADRLGEIAEPKTLAAGPSAAVSGHPLTLLERFAGDADLVRRDFPLTRHPRLLVKNNLAWAAVMAKNGYRAVARSGTRDAVELAVDAAIESKWGDVATVHTLGAALYQRALENDAGAVRDGRSVVAMLDDLYEEGARDLTRAQIDALRDCFGRIRERLDVSKCVPR